MLLLNIPPCKSCELIGRALAALGFSHPKWLLRDPKILEGIKDIEKCLSAILRWDAQEEATGKLDLNKAAQAFRTMVETSSLPSTRPWEIESWIDRLATFVFLERKALKQDYASLHSYHWYTAKSVDVRWAAVQIARLLGRSPWDAEREVQTNMDNFIRLEIYDDLVDHEHFLMWRYLNITGCMPFGRFAWQLAQDICSHNRKYYWHRQQSDSRTTLLQPV